MKAIDLFAGVGGMSSGFSSAGIDVVLAIEYNANIAEGYKLNHPSTKVIVSAVEDLDIRKTFNKYKKNGDVDLIFGGPPCQGFSQKGMRKKVNDKRNYLFNYFADVVEYLRPEFFVIENVPNILTTADCFFYEEIKKTFNNLGYEIKAQVLDSSNFGIPQTRKRAFIVGQLSHNYFDFPSPSQKKITIKDAISDLPQLLSGEGSDFYQYPFSAKSNYQKLLRRNSVGIYNHQSTKHSKVALERLALIPKNGGDKSSLPKKHLTKSIYSGTWTRLHEDKFARTITTRFDTPSSGQFTLPWQDRCLTVREAARIQSFPDRFVFTGTKSNQMIQVGNAVPPLLAQAIAEKIIKAYKLKHIK
jgi:DNA-cytosine methyltransferase